MNEQTCLDKMISPGMVRPSKPYLNGVIQILVTSSCDKNCYNCTQMSQLRRKPTFMSPDQFEQAVLSLSSYFGVIGCFGGNPCLSPHFKAYCTILTKHVSPVQRGLWANNPIKLENAEAARKCFNPSFSNINVHLDQKAFDMWKQGWPECRPVGLTQDSRHSPCFVSMTDLGVPESKRWELISNCDINKFWSALVTHVPGKGLRGFFCEIGGAMALHHADDPDWPDYGIPIDTDGTSDINGVRGLWWMQSMPFFQEQVRHGCHSCGVPLRGHGELAMSDTGKEQVSQTHAVGYDPKRKGRPVELVTDLVQLGMPLLSTTAYLQNASAK